MSVTCFLHFCCQMHRKIGEAWLTEGEILYRLVQTFYQSYITSCDKDWLLPHRSFLQ